MFSWLPLPAQVAIGGGSGGLVPGLAPTPRSGWLIRSFRPIAQRVDPQLLLTSTCTAPDFLDNGTRLMVATVQVVTRLALR
jgi:hypothetical protein